MVQKFLSTEQLDLRLGDLQEHCVQSLPVQGQNQVCCVLSLRDYYPFQETRHAKRTSILVIYNVFVCVSPIQFSWAKYQYSYKYWSTAALSFSLLPLFVFSSSRLASLRKKSGETTTSPKSPCSTGVHLHLPSTDAVKCRCGKKARRDVTRLGKGGRGCCLYLLGCEMRCWVLGMPFVLLGFCG